MTVSRQFTRAPQRESKMACTTGPHNPVRSVTKNGLVLDYFLLYRGCENQRQMKSNMLVFRKTRQGEEFCELNREMAGSLPSTSIHKDEDESDGKIFAVEDSPTCLVQTKINYLSHLNPASELCHILLGLPACMTNRVM